MNSSRHDAAEVGREGAELRRWIVAACLGALRRVATNAWPLLQSTAAATAAWWLARWLDDHPQPFFAPMAAVVALNASRGQRGANALRLLAGVVVGIVAGELAVSALGGSYGTLALATLTAMAAAFALGGVRVTIAQAATSAILTVAVADGQAGPNRLVDALIGAGVALAFTQVLFSPEPLALLRRAEAAALAEMADGLELTARALEGGDDELDERAMSSLWELRDRLAERTGSRIGELAVAVGELATAPGDRATRQRAAGRVLALARSVAASPPRSQTTLTVSAAIQMVATDIVAFTGVDPGRAADVVREGTGDLDVPEPPPAPRSPFRRDRRWRPTR